jgi:alpha-N-arabinofuranosidase
MSLTTLTLTGSSFGLARETLLGANLDWTSDLPEAISSERVRNPTFRGPAEPGTGLAPGWKKLLEFSGGYYFTLEPGHNRAGGPGQRMHVTGGEGWLVQPGCWVRRGETLRLVLWARCQGAPVTVRVGFRHRGLAGPTYGEATVQIDRSYFHRYEAEITLTADDAQSLFFCHVTHPGMVYFDRISARPADGATSRADTVAAMRALAVPDLRWPAGCTSTGYHWKRGVGPEDARHDDADPIFHWGMSYTWGTDEYLELCRQTGARPHLIANVGTGTPQEAAEWAAYCAAWYRHRGVEPPAMVWQIGNEHYGAHEIGHMGPEQYVTCLRDYIPGIRAHYPHPLICTTALGEQELAFLAPMLTAEVPVDLVAVHHYACRVGPDPVQEALGFVADAAAYGRGLETLAATLRQAGSPAALAVTEWGAFRGEAHTDARFCEPDTAGAMLFVAAMLNEYCRQGDRVQLANFYSLINFMPAIIARGPAVARTMKYALLHFWRPLLPATIDVLQVDGPTFAVPGANDTTLPWIDALAGTTAAGAWLLLTNRHPTESLSVQLTPEYAGAIVDRLLPSADGLQFDCRENAEVAGETLTLPPWSHARLRARSR